MAITRAKKKTTKSEAEKPAETAAEFIAAAVEEPVTAEPASFEPPSNDTPVRAREHRAQVIVERHLPWAAAGGFVPVPGLDLASIFAVQLRMLAQIGNVYGIPFREQAAKSAIAGLMAGIMQRTLAGGLAVGLKFIPVIGTLAGVTALPVLAAAGTYAIGRVFIMHFEAGGTFLDLDPDRMRSYFRTEYDAARREPALLRASTA